MSALHALQIDVGIDASDAPDGIRELARAGADEFFAGYVPPQWSDRYGWEIGLNRRTFGANCQFTSLEGLAASIAAAHEVGRRVFITFNAHDYHAEEVPLLRQIVLDAAALEPDALVVADPALLELLSAWDVVTPVHLSIGAGSFNAAAIRHLAKVADVRRVVLPRKMTLKEMQTLILGLADLDLEFEALVIGYRCLFNDEFCFTRHTGTGEPFCNSFVPDPGASASRRLPPEWKDVAMEAAQAPDEQFLVGSALDRFRKKQGGPIRPRISGTDETSEATEGLDGLLASSLFTHSALCAIPGLRDAGVTVLKVPVRGTGGLKLRNLEVVRQVADHPAPTREFCRGLIGSPDFCDRLGNCYYASSEGPLGVPQVGGK